MRNRTFRRAGAVTGLVLASTLAAGATAQAATAAPADAGGQSQSQGHHKPGHPAKPGKPKPSKQRGEVTNTASKEVHGKKVTVLQVTGKGDKHVKRTWIAPESAKVKLDGKSAKAAQIDKGDTVRAHGFKVPAKVAKKHHQKHVSIARGIAAHSER